MLPVGKRAGMACRCGHCNNTYKVDINIQKDMWDRINPSGVMLCGKCIIDKLESIGYDAFELKKTQPFTLWHCTDKIEEIKSNGVLWGNSIGDYSTDSARRTFLSIEPIEKYGQTTIMVRCENYNVVDMDNGEYIINEPIAFYRDCVII